jgi:hypothetical protein
VGEEVRLTDGGHGPPQQKRQEWIEYRSEVTVFEPREHLPVL